MYIWNPIVTAPCCFPVNCIALKVVENSDSMLYQHFNIIESGGVGWRAELSNHEKVTPTIYSIFLVIKNRPHFLISELHVLWYQEIGLFFFLYQEIGLIFLYHRFFFSYQEMDFLYQKSIFDITKYRMNSKNGTSARRFTIYSIFSF